MSERRCVHCLHNLEGRRRLFCSEVCRKRAERRRKAGLREHDYNGERGAARGRVPLTELTRREARFALWRYPRRDAA